MRRKRQHRYREQRAGLLKMLARVFRERQVYLRSGGEVQFITLRPWVQATGLALLLAGFFWLAFSTINMVFKNQLLAVREQGMYDARLEYEDRIADLRRQVDTLNDKLMIDQGQYLGKVDGVRAQFDKLLERHKSLVEFFHQMVNRRSGTDAVVKQDQNAPIPEKPTDEEPADTQDNPDTGSLPGKSEIDDQSFANKYAADFHTASDALRPLTDMQNAFAQYEKMELALLDEAVADAQARADRVKKIFSQLGINAKKVIANSEYATEATGGPYIPVSLAGGDEVKDIESRMERILDMYAAYDTMKHEAVQLPLYLPMRNIKRINSGFGYRRDPFRKTLALHAGVDFKGDLGSPVYATADGRVTVGELEGSYGRLVEIAHDNGVVTRYAHLSEIDVAAGTRVKRGQLIGKLGNTGRSTGPHLHYETRVSGRAIDPVQFWQARYAVQKLAQEE